MGEEVKQVSDSLLLTSVDSNKLYTHSNLLNENEFSQEQIKEESKPEEKKEEKAEEKKEVKAEEKKEEKAEEKKEEPKPPSPFVLFVDLHCVGCAKKIERTLLRIRGHSLD